MPKSTVIQSGQNGSTWHNRNSDVWGQIGRVIHPGCVSRVLQFPVLCWLPWRRGLCHPHQVHVTGEHRQLGWQLGIVHTTRTPIGQEHINQQLKVGLPPDRLPKQNDCYSKAGSLWWQDNQTEEDEMMPWYHSSVSVFSFSHCKPNSYIWLLDIVCEYMFMC